jgi:ABC-type transport system involved in multi-copper enzyme maturation permease subunit
MLKLIKLEVVKNKIHTYLFVMPGITVVMFGFLYLFAGVNGQEEELSSYSDVVMLVSSLSMASYAIFGAVMFSKFVVEEYKGKRAILLFSYPVSRMKVLIAKILLVCAFTLVGSLLTNAIVFGFFNVTESFAPLVHEGVLSFTLTNSIVLFVLEALLAVAISLISVQIGLWKQSVPATIITAVIIVSLASSICTQFLMNATPNTAILLILVPTIIAIASAAIALTVRRVDAIEV